MKMIKFIIFSLVFFTFFSCENEQLKKEEKWLVSVPTQDEYLKIDVNGVSIDPLGRRITPRGKTFRIAPHPYGLVLSNDGNIAITANSGTGPFSITIIKNLKSDNPEIRQIPEGVKNDDDLLGAVFMGLAISPDNQKVYVAGGQENKIYVFDLKNYSKIKEISCYYLDSIVDYTHGYIGDMKLSKDGKTLYAIDQIGFRLIIIDTETGAIKHNLPTGRYPFGLTLSNDEKNAYVANVGMYEYKPFRHLNPNNLSEKALNFQPFAYNTKESIEGIKNDSIDVPGLGDPNSDMAFSVWAYSLENNPKITNKIKTGYLVGEVIEGIPAVGGSSPNSLVTDGKYVYVSNGSNDLISVIDPKNGKVIDNIKIIIDDRVANYRGIIPFGLAVSPDNKTLYCACSGINAIASIDLATRKINGFIPAGWFPSKLAVTPDNKYLIVANAKGYGSGPNGGDNFVLGPEGSNIGKLMKGSVSIMTIPNKDEIKTETQKVLDNNFKFTLINDELIAKNKDNPIPLYPGEKQSPIKYVIFIAKENRTFDEVFGQFEGVKGDPKLARYGLQRSFTNKKGNLKLEKADVMINHWQLAKRFGISDNFYVNSDHSADGHRWLANTYPNEWVETSTSAAYGGKRRVKQDSKAPGNFAFVGASGAIYPEDYNQHGSLWDHLERNKKEFFNFGFGLEMGIVLSDSLMKYTGVKHIINYPLPKPLFERSSKLYATYNMAIPDQFRVDMFIKEFNDRWIGEGKELPSVLTILLPNDHGADDRPWAGYPFRESYMADNDLALGRIVEFLSHTPYWRNMAIFVTEDDSQDGVDHVDAHRSILMVISPYVKKNYISKKHSSFGSIFKTMFNILGIPYLNLYDATANDLSDFFTNEPDFTPYKAYPVDKRVFDPQKALDPFDEKFNWKEMLQSPKIDYPADLQKSADERDKKQIMEREKLSNPRKQK